MMPLTFANVGEENCIRKIGGNPETKKFLENLGFVVGGSVIVVNEINGNMLKNPEWQFPRKWQTQFWFKNRKE